MQQLFDLHIHTEFSDGKGTVAEKIERAQELGLDLIAITDHFAEPLEYRMSVGQLAELQKIVKGREYAIPVLLGVETGIEGVIPPGLLSQVDFIIRSVHFLRQPIKATSPFDPLYWAAYQDEVIALLEIGADVLGHIEGYLPLPLGKMKTTFEERREMDRQVARRFFTKEWQETVARLAAKKRVAIELHAFSQTPRLEFIRLCQREGCLFSVGSDAHSTAKVGQVDWAFEVIKEFDIPNSQLLPYARGWLS